MIKDFGEDTAITSGGSLPQLEPGCYKVYVRGVSGSGTAGPAASAGVLHVDSSAPDVGEVTLKGSDGASIDGKWTGETNPLIGFSGVTDSHIDATCLSYAIVPKGTDPSASDFKSAAELSISGSRPYSGTFRLAAADRALTSGITPSM